MWTQGIQSANIYPNLIALSALVEKKDAKVRVDVRCLLSRGQGNEKLGTGEHAKQWPTVVLSFKNVQATSWNEKNMGATPFHSI